MRQHCLVINHPAAEINAICLEINNNNNTLNLPEYKWNGRYDTILYHLQLYH